MNILVLTSQPQAKLGIMEGLKALGHQVSDVFIRACAESDQELILTEFDPARTD